jgi:hypothetical protein
VREEKGEEKGGEWRESGDAKMEMNRKEKTKPLSEDTPHFERKRDTRGKFAVGHMTRLAALLPLCPSKQQSHRNLVVATRFFFFSFFL